jgi:nucleotide-binding universal stress UspA family protein
MFKRILAATDGSDGAAKALYAAIELAAINKAALIVLNVFNSQETFAGRQSGGVEFARAEHLQGDYAEAEQILSEDVLAGAKAAVGKHPHIAASFVSLDGDPATEILRYAREAEADTIVLGSRGRGRLAGLLLGSVSQKVASLAPQIAVIVRHER